jgi:hypothetical protein
VGFSRETVSGKETGMDDFEILTWVAAFVFVMLGIGFPDRDRFGMKRESESDIDGFGLADEEFRTEGIQESGG